VVVLEFSKKASCGGVLFALGAMGLHYPKEVGDLVPRLIKYLDSTDLDVKMNAKVALGRLGDPAGM